MFSLVIHRSKKLYIVQQSVHIVHVIIQRHWSLGQSFYCHDGSVHQSNASFESVSEIVFGDCLTWLKASERFWFSVQGRPKKPVGYLALTLNWLSVAPIFSLKRSNKSLSSRLDTTPANAVSQKLSRPRQCCP